MSALRYSRPKEIIGSWQGPDQDLKVEPKDTLDILQDLSKNCFLIDYQGQIASTNTGSFQVGFEESPAHPAAAFSPSISPSDFGDPAFKTEHGSKFAYMAGSMANAISGIELVTTMGKAGYLASYGSGGVAPDKLLEAIRTIKNELPPGP